MKSITRLLSGVVCAVVMVTPAPATADVQALTSDLVHVDPSEISSWAPSAGAPVLYLNRCRGGCEVNPGKDDSVADRSSLVWQTRQLSEYAFSDSSWRAVVECVAATFAPFALTVTDQDPGTAPHFEVMVAGTAAELGFQPADGLAPASCEPIDNALTFTFAQQTGASATRTCEVIAQEASHGFGLDHVIECLDPLSWDSGCGYKEFQDQEMPCGEFVERECMCGGATQNTYQYLLALFGEGSGEIPAVRVEIVSPLAGASVAPGFVVRLDTGYRVEQVELYVNGALAGSLQSRPHVLNAPVDLAPGLVELEVRAIDDQGNEAITRRQVYVPAVEEHPESEVGETDAACAGRSCAAQVAEADVPMAAGGCHAGHGMASSHDHGGGLFALMLGLLVVVLRPVPRRKRVRRRDLR